MMWCIARYQGATMNTKTFSCPRRASNLLCIVFHVLDIRATKKNNTWLPPSSCSPKYGNDEEPGSRKREIVHIRLHHSCPNKVRTSCPTHMSLLPLLLNFSSLGIDTRIPMGKVRNH